LGNQEVLDLFPFLSGSYPARLPVPAWNSAHTKTLVPQEEPMQILSMLGFWFALNALVAVLLTRPHPGRTEVMRGAATDRFSTQKLNTRQFVWSVSLNRFSTERLRQPRREPLNAPDRASTARYPVNAPHDL
jgi:hypothetical protein